MHLQDVCVAIFTMKDDIIAKVTDICGTDPNNPSHCASPENIKLPKKKVQTIYYYKGKTEDVPELQSAQHPEQIYWNFAKCLGEVCLSVFFFLLPPLKLRPPRPTLLSQYPRLTAV